MDDITEEELRYHQILVRATRLVAASYEQQCAALPSFGHIPDEVALTFGHAFDLLGQPPGPPDLGWSVYTGEPPF